MQIEIAALIIFSVWLLIVSFVLFNLTRFLRKLTKGVSEGDIKKVLSEILITQDKNTRGLAEVKKQVEDIERQGTFHIQKIGLVRFNPFKDTGGDQSFSVAILDANLNGILITALHTRERTRLYSKLIVKGKSEFELSQEEGKALSRAQKS